MKHDYDIKPQILRSMEMSWTPRPMYKTKAQNTTPKARVERRSQKIRRFFWHVKDDIGIIILAAVMFVAGILMWGAMAGIEQCLKPR